MREILTLLVSRTAVQLNKTLRDARTNLDINPFKTVFVKSRFPFRRQDSEGDIYETFHMTDVALTRPDEYKEAFCVDF